MAFGLDDALLGWLLGATGDAVVNRVRDPAKKAMRQVAEEAIRATVAAISGDLDEKQAEHLCSVLREHNVVFSPATVNSRAELRVAVRTWTAALDRPMLGGPGYLASLGLDADRIGEELADRIAAGIRANGRTGGPLNLFAEWLWRDELEAGVDELEGDVDEIKEGLAQLRGMVQPPRSSGGLPGGTPRFVGRHEVLEELAERVRPYDPAGVVVAIHAVDGMAGIGKTELALRAAHQHKHRYPDGQYFINLHGYTEGIPPMPAEAALEELLRQAGMQGAEIPPDLASRQARWQALMATQRALVLLDNALDAAQVRPLLPMAAGCLVLITSRTRLPGLPGARTLRLDVLPLVEAVELFTRLAGAKRSGDQDIVARIVELVGRLPVAVEAVAGQMHDELTLTELAEDLVASKARSGLVDETSLPGAGVRAAFETSLQRLDQLHQWAFRVLGLHPGPTIGVPQFAALAGLPTTRARQVLRGLADSSLITPTSVRAGHRRYELHDLLREFARKQAGSHMSIKERSAAIARLTTWYATVTNVLGRVWDDDTELAESAVESVSMNGPGEARAWLVAEQDNLLAFAELATGEDAGHVCYRFAHRLYLLDHCATARALHLRAADIYQQTGNQVGKANALNGLGRVAVATGDCLAASEHYRAALAVCQQTGNRDGEAVALSGLGGVARLAGDYPAAAEQYRHVLAIYQQAGNQPGEAAVLTGLGHVARLTGEYPIATEHYRAALAIYQQTGNQDGEAKAQTGLGAVARITGNSPVGAEYYRRALAIYKQTGSRLKEAYALTGLGDTALAAGDYPTARERYSTALATYRQTGNQAGQAHVLTGLGHALRSNGECPTAKEHYRTALAICQQTGNRAGEAAALTGLGHAARTEGQYEVARERWQSALAIAAEIGSPLAESVRQVLDELAQE